MNKESAVKTVFILLFICFLTIYISQATGYYEYKLHKKAELTKEQITKFENDVKNNEKIDLNDYLKDGVKDYSNSVSKMGTDFSNVTSKYIKKGIDGMFKIIDSLLT